MAARRRKVQHGMTQKRRRIIIGVVALGMALVVGGTLRALRGEPKEEPAATEPGAAPADQLRLEVEARRAAAEQRARDLAEEARQQEQAAEPPQPTAPELADDAPSPTPEEPPPAKAEPAAEPTAEQQPAPRPTPPADETPADEKQGDETPDDAPKPKPQPEPADETPDDAQPPAPDEPPAPSIKPGVVNPYAGSYTLLGSVSLPMQKQWNEMVDKMLSRRQPAVFAAALRQKICNDVLPEIFADGRFKYALYSKSVNLMNAVEFCYVVQIMGNEGMRKFLTLRDVGDFMRWLMTDKTRPLHRLLQAHKMNSGERNTMAHTLETLYKIWRRSPNSWELQRYMNLALACALVHPSIADGRGSILDEKEVLPDMTDVFDIFRKGDSARTLRGAMDLKKISVSNLLHLVDVRLPLSEFEWTRKNILLRRDKWKQLYDASKIKTDIVLKEEKDTDKKPIYTKYTFEELTKEGFTSSADMAYYTATTAKSAGIPAVIISGMGSSAEQSWVGIMNNERAWTQVGTFGYNGGYFVNPCSLKKQHESTLFHTDNNLTEERLQPMADVMLLAELLALWGDCDAEALCAASYVTETSPRYVTGWAHRVAIMEMLHERHRLDGGKWRQLLQEMDRAPVKNSELVALAHEVDMEHVIKDLRGAVKVSALKRAYKKLTNPLTGRTDLLLECISQQADVYAYDDKKRELVAFYRQVFRDNKDRADIYVELVRQCNKWVQPDDKALFKDLAHEADVNFIKQAFKSPAVSRVSMDEQVLKAIANLYTKAGDQTSANRLQNFIYEKKKGATKYLKEKKASGKTNLENLY